MVAIPRPFQVTETERQTDRQTDRQTETDRDRQTETDRQKIRK